MILVVGGRASGKRTYVRSLGYADDAMAAGLAEGRPVALNVHELVEPDMVEGSAAFAALVDQLAQKDVVTCCEVGSGIVPADAAELAWRDNAGRLCAALAARSEHVVRTVCGIPQLIR